MKIDSISHYRDGGSVSILVSDINVEQLKTLGLPTEPKIIGDNPIYEIFRNFGIDSKDKCKYFFGDINGEYKELFLDNPILLEVKKLLEQEKIKRGFYSIEKFLISL